MFNFSILMNSLPKNHKESREFFLPYVLKTNLRWAGLPKRESVPWLACRSYPLSVGRLTLEHGMG